MTHLITNDSIAFIDRHKDEPFFLFVSHECPHFPFQGPNDKDKLVNEDNWTERDTKTYVAMLEIRKSAACLPQLKKRGSRRIPL